MQDKFTEKFVYDSTNEAVVIGASIADEKVRKKLVRQLSPDEFLVKGNSSIWQMLKHLADEGLDYSENVSSRVLQDLGAEQSTLEYLRELESDAEVPDNIEWHVQTLKWDATRARALEGPIPELIRSIQDPRATPQDVQSSARSLAKAVEDTGGRRYIHRPDDLSRKYKAEIAARRVKRNVYPIGYEAVDSNFTEGFMPGRTSLLAGVSGSGKTTFAVHLSIRLAMIGRKVLYCAWEMPSESILDVAISNLTGIELSRIIQGNVTDKEFERITKAARWITARIKFMDNPFFAKRRAKKGRYGRANNEENLDTLEGYLADSGCDVAIYDLWQRMLPQRNPDEEASALFRMQDIHAEYGVHGVIVQQLNLKQVEVRIDKRPTREAIKGTGAYVEVPDLIFGIHRPAMFKAVDDNALETICLKQRKGKAMWSIQWAWNGDRCGITNPKEVPFDPGLEQVVEVGDIAAPKSPRDIKTRKPSWSREQ